MKKSESLSGIVYKDPSTSGAKSLGGVFLGVINNSMNFGNPKKYKVAQQNFE